MLESSKIDYLEIKCPYCDEVFDYVLWDEMSQHFVSYTKSIGEDRLSLSTMGRFFHKSYSPKEFFICEKCHKPFNLREKGKIPPSLEQLEEDNMFLEKRNKFYLKSVNKLDKIKAFLKEHAIISREKFEEIIKEKL